MAGFIKELMKYQVNSFPAVNTLYNGLFEFAGFDKVDFSKLKTSFAVAWRPRKAVAEAWLKHHRLRAVRGLWPVGNPRPTLTCNPADTDKFSGSIGCPFHRPISPSATMTATKCRSASPAKSAPRVRR